MKKEEFIKLGLDEEIASKCENASKEELKGYIPKSRFDEVNNEKKKLEMDILERNNQLESLKNSNDSMEELKKKIETLQSDNKKKDEEYSAKIKQLKIDTAIDIAINNAKGKNLKAIKALLNLDNIELAEDGTIKGLSEQMDKLIKADDSKFLFNLENKQTIIKGVNPGESGNEVADTKVDISKMTYSELAAYMSENPNVKID